ncbi:MAG: hypothetical protein RBU30_19970 [Polyangia bacterium]|jgi:hypothetical protein|nr:hypothetical protein [Polyangia bacterium]
MSLYILEPTEQPEQRPEWDYQVELGGLVWRLVLRWFERFEQWGLTVYDDTDTLMVSQEPILVNRPCLTHHTGRIPTGGQLWLLSLNGSDEACSYDDLGTRCQLVWATDDDEALDEDSSAEEFTYSATP